MSAKLKEIALAATHSSSAVPMDARAVGRGASSHCRLERMFPDLPKLKLFSRREREDRAGWENESTTG
jgi:hypothetical protein